MVHQVTIGTLATRKFRRVYLILLPGPRYKPSSALPDTHSAALPPNIGCTCMCLYVVLLVNNGHYWLVWKVKDNINCKTMLYCTREITLSWKKIIMLNINGLVIKLFPALYLVIIYIEYMCVHMCIMNLHVHSGAYAFSRFPCYLVVFPSYRFNKAY